VCDEALVSLFEPTFDGEEDDEKMGEASIVLVRGPAGSRVFWMDGSPPKKAHQSPWRRKETAPSLCGQ